MKEDLIFAIIIGTYDLSILISVILLWYEDCKEIGKDNLAVSLKERLITYIVFVILPSLIPFVK